jgi:hypothetical protein
MFDLVVINEHATTYRQDLQDELQQTLDNSPENPWADRPGGVFLRRADLILKPSPADIQVRFA